MSAHTPGPWETDRNNIHAGLIATIYHCAGNDWVEVWSSQWPADESTQEANARLIAAAPELLGVLTELFEIGQVFNSAIEAHGFDGGFEDWAVKARAAITKATGEVTP